MSYVIARRVSDMCGVDMLSDPQVVGLNRENGYFLPLSELVIKSKCVSVTVRC